MCNKCTKLHALFAIFAKVKQTENEYVSFSQDQ